MADWTLTKYPAAGYTATLTADASAHTKGAYVELTASGGAAGFYLSLSAISAQALSFLLDIATGAAASETVGLANYHVSLGGPNGRLVTTWVYVPLRIAAGSRISARCQCDIGGSTVDIALYAVSDNSGLPVCGRATTYGATTADSGGTSVDPGASVDTKGAYSEVTASCTNGLDYVVMCFGNQSNIAETDGRFLIDLATGAASSETVIQADLPLYDSAALDVKMPPAYGFAVTVAASTRLAVRAQCSMNNATDRLFDALLIGFDQLESVGGGSGTARRPRARLHGV